MPAGRPSRLRDRLSLRAVQGGGGSRCARPSSPRVRSRLLPSRCCWRGWWPGSRPRCRCCARAPSQGVAASFTISGGLSGVAATSASNAWAVGSTGSKTLILRWNGRRGSGCPARLPPAAVCPAWPLPLPVTPGRSAAAALHRSPKTLILPGTARPGSGCPARPPPARPVRRGRHVRPQRLGGRLHRHGKTLILRWNGTAWKQVPSPPPPAPSLRSGRHLRPQRLGGRLTTRRHQRQDPDPALERHGVEAGAQPEPGPAGLADSSAAWPPRPPATPGRSATSAAGAAPALSLILRWNGTAWKRVPSPTPAGGAALRGVAATSARSAWAVGDTSSGDSSKTVILRWNGTAWKQVPSPSPGASSVCPAWLPPPPVMPGRSAALSTAPHGSGKTLILRWNGKTWK